jgi:C4-dicarboxylate-specific signal transduction histidine kinase
VIDVGQLVGECLNQLRPELSSQRVTCEVLTADRLPGVHGSRPQLLQVLVDLVRHSLDARPGAQPRDRRVRVHARRHDGGAVAIWVENSAGAGIPSHSHPRLAFWRSVVTAHGGHISVTPDERGGAAFKVILPASS